MEKRRKTRKTKIKRPNSILYAVCVFIANVFIRVCFGFKKPKLPDNLKEPFVVLGNHTCKLDYMFMASALYPHRMNFLVSAYYTTQRFTGAFLKLMQCIPKYQFQADLPAISSMISVIAQRGIVAIYPQGQVPYDAVMSKLPPGLGKLLKLLSCDVVAFKTDGGYFIYPKWAKGMRRGKPEFNTRVILAKEDVRALSVEQIEEKVKISLDFNDYIWQMKRNKPFKGRNLAERIEGILYSCPVCKAEYSIASSGDHFKCASCNSEGTLLANGDISSEDFDFQNPYEWMLYQKMLVSRQLKSEDFTMSDDAVLKLQNTSGAGYYRQVSGKITLTKQGFAFISETGDVKYDFRPDKLGFIACIIAENFEIGSGGTVYCFFPSNKASVIKWLLAAEEVFRIDSENTERK